MDVNQVDFVKSAYGREASDRLSMVRNCVIARCYEIASFVTLRRHHQIAQIRIQKHFCETFQSRDPLLMERNRDISQLFAGRK